MKKFLQLMVCVFISALFFVGHSDAQIRKAYILSEGGLSAGSSRLSRYDIPSNTFTLNFFNNGNIGLFPDGMIFYKNLLYVLAQGQFGGEGMLWSIDTNGNSIDGQPFGTNPYSLAIVDDTVYTTNGPAGKVILLETPNFSSTHTINVGVYPQEIMAIGNKVFVCNTSEFGGDSDSTVSVISTITKSVIATISVMKDPSSLAITNDGKLLIGCPGGQGRIYKVDPVTHQKLDSFALKNGFDKDIAVDRDSDNIYYISYTNAITRLNLSTRVVTEIIPNPNPSAVYFYGYNYDYTNDLHFVCDAKNFIVNGALNIYNNAGTLMHTFTTSIAPRRITFQTSGTTSISYEPQIVNDFELKQNYPNPFNPSTTIEFSIYNSGFAKLSVFDMNGREVAVLVNQNLKPGLYKAKFDAQNLSTGVYYYKLISNNNTETKKMLLIK